MRLCSQTKKQAMDGRVEVSSGAVA